MADSDRELISRLLSRSSRLAVEDHDTRPKTAARVRELEKALAAEQMRSTMAERRAALAEERARQRGFDAGRPLLPSNFNGCRPER